jgi:hypothetical protein
MQLEEYLDKGYSVEIRVLHRGSYLGGWDWGFEENKEIELEASWRILINPKDIDNLYVEFCPVENPTNRFEDYYSEEIVVANKDKSVIGFLEEESIINSLNENIESITYRSGYNHQKEYVFNDYLKLEVSLWDLFEQFENDFDHSYRLFSEVIEINYYKGKEKKTDLFVGSSRDAASNHRNGIFTLLSLLKFEQKFPYYHVAPELANIGLRINGIKSIISCAVPYFEAVNLLSVLSRFSDYEGNDDPKTDMSMNEFIYTLPTLNGRVYKVNLGDILEVLWNDEFRETSLPLVDFEFFITKNGYNHIPNTRGLLDMPKNIRVLYKNASHFIDYNLVTDEYCEDFSLDHLYKCNHPVANRFFDDVLNITADETEFNIIRIYMRNVPFLALDIFCYGPNIYNILGFHYFRWNRSIYI